MRLFVIHAAICLTYYILGAYATTDILRLLKGCSTPVIASSCCCPVCHRKISLSSKIPVLSYFKNHGACYHCKSPIPKTDLFLEIFLFTLQTGISCAMHFSWAAFCLCVFSYEITKVVFIFRFGKRESGFLKNLLTSLALNTMLFTFLAMLFLMEHIIRIPVQFL